MRLIAAVLLLGLAMAGAAGGATAPPPGPGATLFISPAGEPFRGRDDGPYPVAAWFAQADTDHDGKLTRKEFVADALRFFAVLDLNKDGRIDSAEVSYYEQVLVPEVLAGGTRVGALEGRIIQVQMDMGDAAAAPDDPPAMRDHGPRIDGAAPYNLLGEPEPVTAADLSFSGRISPGDFQRRAEQRFARLDRAGVGYLELASLPRTLAQSAGGRRRRGA